MTSHTCVPSFFDMGPSATCSEVVKVDDKWVRCGTPLVRIMHGPGHTIDGKPCGFPEQWRYCYLPASFVEARAADLLRLPDWKLA